MDKMTSQQVSGVRAVILAGGKGTRLRPLTAVFPKPLVPLGDKAVIEILLTRLASSGLKDVTISTGYLASLIHAVCGDGSRFGLNIEYVGEDRPLGTAGSLTLIPNLTDPCIVMNGDLLTTLDFRSLIEFHQKQKADFTAGIYSREVKIDFGVVEFDSDNEFNGFREKPTYHFDVSMGVNVIGLATIRDLPKGEHLDMPDLILKVHRAGGRVKCYREPCRWLDIGRMDDYAQAQDDFAANEAAFLYPAT